jgi:hypothetical protein
MDQICSTHECYDSYMHLVLVRKSQRNSEILSNCLLSEDVKIGIYKTIILHVDFYDCET